MTGSGEKEIRMTELFSIKKHIQDVAGSNVNIIEGIGVEDDMDDEISVTVIATGFKVSKNIGATKPITPKIYNLDKDEQEEVTVNTIENSVTETETTVADQKEDNLLMKIHPILSC